MTREQGDLCIDLVIVSGQLGRTARDVTGIAVRCPFGRPAVIETAPTLGGTPNPTLLYLTCPTAVTAVSRAESAGGVRRFKATCRADPELRDALEEATRAYRRRRARLARGVDPRPEAGIGGPAGPTAASCLHAYTAALLAAFGGWLDEEAEADAAFQKEPPRRAAQAAARAWDRFLPPVESLWCVDDRCARYVIARPQAGSHRSDTPGSGPQAGDERVAAIDVGTISVRLLVADLRAGRPEAVVRRAEVTRLGEGLQAGAPLGGAPAARTTAVVAKYVTEARELGAAKILVAGTSATRDAADGSEYIRGLGAEHGADSAVLSGEDEARLAYTGASLDVKGDFVLLDVGGGSTELIRRAAGGQIEAVSLDLGASRATERWIHSDPPSPRELDAVQDEARAGLEALRARFGACPAGLVGVAGTVTTLACLDTGLEVYRAEDIHLRTLSLATVELLIARLAAMTTAERAALPCVQAGRAPVIVAGAVIARTAMEALGYAGLTVSERDLLDGLVLEAARS